MEGGYGGLGGPDSVRGVVVGMAPPPMTPHVVVFCGWEAIGEGWTMGCCCGWESAVLFLMVEVGQAWDDHLVVAGVLVEE